MPIPAYVTTCTAKERLCASAFEVRLRMPEGESLKFQAGQFVLFDVPGKDDPEEIQPRAYSVASPPSEESELTFVVENRLGGRAGDWVRDVLAIGDPIRIQGPFGPFTLDIETEKDYLFVATGTGAAPFRSHLLDALIDRGDERPMQLLFGCRYEEDFFWIDEFQALEKSYPSFSLTLTLS